MAEDLTGTVRLPAKPEKADPFEEEYRRAGAESAIEAFEKPRPGSPPDAFDIWTAGQSGNQVAPPSPATGAWRGPLAGPSFGEKIAEATGGKTAEKGPGKPALAAPAGAGGETVALKVSTVARTNGGLSDADIERLAARVVEKLSDKVVREIAWEVIPDMAEIVIKQRIKELESGIE
ncbi:MAG: hypothetical protein ACRD1B_11160 [Thermoanaerobaculia bacterium]